MQLSSDHAPLDFFGFEDFSIVNGAWLPVDLDVWDMQTMLS